MSPSAGVGQDADVACGLCHAICSLVEKQAAWHISLRGRRGQGGISIRAAGCEECRCTGRSRSAKGFLHRAMQQSLAARSQARQRAAGGSAARPGRAGRRGGAASRRPHAPAAVGAAFSRQPADFYTALVHPAILLSLCPPADRIANRAEAVEKRPLCRPTTRTAGNSDFVE